MCILPLGVLIIVISRYPFALKFFLSFIDCESGSTLTQLLSLSMTESFYSKANCTDHLCRILIQIPVVFHTSKPLTTLALDGNAVLSFASDGARHVRRRLDDYDGVDKLPETSSGFRARVVVSNADTASSSAGLFGGSRSDLLLAWSLIAGGLFLF